jgi:carbon monoxide dehydrogenase subunit G
MSEAIVKKQINIPAEKAWATIRQFDGVDTYLPAVASCRVEGEGVGAKRFCTLQDGVKLDETLEHLDDDQCTLIYSIVDGEMPFKNYVGTVQVNDLGNGQSEVEWKSSFEVGDTDKKELITMIEGMLTTAIDGIEQLHTV